MAQHSQTARNLLRQQFQFVAVLVSFITSKQQQQQQQQQQQPQIANVLAVATWCFTNLLRDDHTTLGMDFCCGNNNTAPISLTITPELLYHLFTSPNEMITSEVSWMIAYLSSREDAIIPYLFTTTGQSWNSLFHALYSKLREISSQQQQQQKQSSLLLLEPLLRIMGNIAISNHGIYVPHLLEDDSFISCLVTLLQVVVASSSGSNASTITTAGSSFLPVLLWVCGCLLTDAGKTQHKSTTLAAPALLPPLLQLLVLATTKMEWKREIVAALWNTLDNPPPSEAVISHSENNNNNTYSFLKTIYEYDAKLQSPNATTPVLMVLKDMLRCKDVDAMYATIHILDRLLREIPESRQVFEQFDGIASLEHVCDYEQDDEHISEMAANLIDDFFDKYDDNDDDNWMSHHNNNNLLTPTTSNSTFVFGLVEQQQEQQQQPPSNFTISTPPGQGRGRGRGTTLPAWMTKMQQ